LKKRFGIFSAVVIAAALTLTGCSSSDSATSESASCAKADLATVTEGKLTIATGEPAYYPWIIDDAPETGNGFEGAVAYAVAKQLGFDAADVVWVRTTFDSAVTPGEKNFDFNLQQSQKSARQLLISHLLTTQLHRQSFPSRAARSMERHHLLI
jgi:polar amino acid transport system substrate-binding protein